jgi:hypothetical protein
VEAEAAPVSLLLEPPELNLSPVRNPICPNLRLAERSGPRAAARYHRHPNRTIRMTRESLATSMHRDLRYRC